MKIFHTLHRLKQPEYQCYRTKIGTAKNLETLERISAELKSLLLVCSYCVIVMTFIIFCIQFCLCTYIICTYLNQQVVFLYALYSVTHQLYYQEFTFTTCTFTSANKASDSFCQAHAPPLLPQAPSGMHPLASLSNNHYTALRLNHSLQEFHPTQQENRELNHLQKIAFLFITLRYLLYVF